MKENLRGRFFVTEEGEDEDGNDVDYVIFHGLLSSLADRLFGLVARNSGKGNKLILHEDEIDFFEDLRETEEGEEGYFDSP